jgi:hypothetical protein
VTTLELLELIRLQHEHSPSTSESRVVIKLDKPSIGGSATCEVKNASFGFDWDNGKFILWPDGSLVKKTEDETLYDETRSFVCRCAVTGTKALQKEARRLLAKVYKDPKRLEEILEMFKRTYCRRG